MKWICALLCFPLGHRWHVRAMHAERWVHGTPAVGRVRCKRCWRLADVERDVALWHFTGARKRVPWRLDDQLDGEWHRRRAQR